MKIGREEAGRILYEADVICMNCVEDTLNNDICDSCPVRKICDELEWEEE